MQRSAQRPPARGRAPASATTTLLSEEEIQPQRLSNRKSKLRVKVVRYFCYQKAKVKSKAKSTEPIVTASTGPNS